MVILGIDPGSRVTGWGVLEASGWDVRCRAHGALRSAQDGLADRLVTLASLLRGVIRDHAPDVMAVEQVFTAKNARSALVLGHARGVVLLCAAEAGVTLHEYAPASIKRAVTGSGRAEKPQVQRALATQLLLAEPPRPLDASDALAVALCHAAEARMANVLARSPQDPPSTTRSPLLAARGARRRARWT